jgi:hypothetical protein
VWTLRQCAPRYDFVGCKKEQTTWGLYRRREPKQWCFSMLMNHWDAHHQDICPWSYVPGLMTQVPTICWEIYKGCGNSLWLVCHTICMIMNIYICIYTVYNITICIYIYVCTVYTVYNITINIYIYIIYAYCIYIIYIWYNFVYMNYICTCVL